MRIGLFNHESEHKIVISLQIKSLDLKQIMSTNLDYNEKSIPRLIVILCY